MIAPAGLLRRRPAADPGDNPFVPITPGWRAALIAYYVVYLVAVPVLQEIALPSATPLAGLRVGLDVLYRTLVFLPILLYRPSFGWLHPLVFPTVLALANELVKTPGELLRPLAVGLVPRESVLRIELLPWYPEEAVGMGELRLLGVRILAVLAYYAGYFLLTRGRAALALAAAARGDLSPRRVRNVALAVAGACLVIVAVFLARSGGIRGHLLSYWVGGRGASETTGGVGIVLTLLNVWLIALLLWYALQPGVQRNPLFVAGVGTQLVLTFFVSGSRSDLFQAVVLFVIVWMLRHRKVPTGRVAMVGALVLLLLGPLGDFRRAVTRTGQVDWSTLTDVRSAVSRTNTEIAMRASRGGGVPVMVRVPGEVDYLYGRSYVGGLLFFVPRIVWTTKPHGASYYNSTLILNRGEFGVPIPPEAEAYWNFALPGVIGVFLLFGVFHRFLAGVFARYGGRPVLWVPYVLALTLLGPSSQMLTTGTRALGASLLILAAMGAWTAAPRRAAPAARLHGFRAPPAPQASGT